MTALALGNLTGEFIQKMGHSYLYLEDAAKAKIVDLTTNEDGRLKAALDWFTPEHQESIAKVIFGFAIVYNFKENKLAFLGGAGLGMFSSMGKVPGWMHFQTLEDGELLSMTASDGFQIQKVMAFIAFLNWYLGDTLLNNLFFGAFSGLIAGNCGYHAAKQRIDEIADNFLATGAGKYVQSFYDDVAERIEKAFETAFGNEQA